MAGINLRILIADGENARLDALAKVVASLGHTVIARELEVSHVSGAIAREHPDLALVEFGASSQHGLDMIERIVHESTCPVIALLRTESAEHAQEAAERGVFACLVDSSAADLDNAIQVALQRFMEYSNLQQAFGRRVVIEQAKGILMGRYAIGGDASFRRLREHSQRTGRKLADVAEGVVANHLLLPTLPPDATSQPDEAARNGGHGLDDTPIGPLVRDVRA